MSAKCTKLKISEEIMLIFDVGSMVVIWYLQIEIMLKPISIVYF